MANYPNIIDTFAQPAGTQTLDNPDHALDHRNIGSAVVGIETVLGTTPSTSVLSNFVFGDKAARKNNETFGTPTIQNPTMGTPAITNGTYNNGVFGTPSLIGGSYVAGTFGTPIVVGAFSNNNIINTFAIDWSKGDVQFGTLTGNGTLTYSNSVTWQRLTLTLIENATGNFSITLPASQYPNGVAPVYGTAAGAKNTIVVIKDSAGSFLTQYATNFS